MTDRPTTSPIGLVGLGLMGSALSTRLLDRGHAVVGFDVDADRRAEHAVRGGDVAGSPAAVADRCEIVLLSLPNSDVGLEVCLGVSSVASSGSGTLVVDTTTGRPHDARRIADGLAERAIRYVDATLSGNSRQAAVGEVVAMVGGAAEDVAAARPVLEELTRSIHHMGPVGAGATTKLIVNLMVGVNRAALAEAIVMAERADLDLDVMLAVLSDGLAYSRVCDVWGERMVRGDHYPPSSRIRQSHKDFRLIVEQGQLLGSPTWLASTVQQLLQAGEGGGLGEADNSAVVEIVRRDAGIGRIDEPRSPGAGSSPGDHRA